MKNRSAFTLIELLAVVVILGVIMMIAIPNTISLLDRSKKTTYIENAKTFVSLVQNKVQVDKKLELPTNSNMVLIITLDYLNTNDISESPYGSLYDVDSSFVAITLEENKYVYYVHLVSCSSKGNCQKNNPEDWDGINLVNVAYLNNDNRYDYIRSSDVNANLINDLNSDSLFINKKLYLNDTRI